MSSEVIHDEKDKKFFINKDGKEARLKYKMEDEQTINFTSTFVPEEFRGEGIAQQLTEYALNFARQKNYSVVATCPYISKFISKHKEYQDMLAG